MEKFTYIKRDIRGFYIEFDTQFDPTMYDNIGTTFQDFNENKWVLLSQEQVAFHKAHPTANVKEVWEMQLTPKPGRTLEDAKREMNAMIDEYDNSSNVNAFTINGTIEGWFTAAERSNYKASIDAAKLIGVNILSFFVNDELMEVSTSDAELMLAQIQLYADKCYIVTKEHKITVESLNSIEDVDSFPYTEGYPTKLDFQFEK